MKKSELIKIINETVEEVIKEGTMVTDKMGNTTYVANEDPAISKDSNIKSATTTGGKKLKEISLKEAAKYSVADEEKAQELIDSLGGAKAKERIKSIIDTISKSETGAMTGGKIAKALGLNVQAQIYNLLVQMEKAGILSATNKISIPNYTTRLANAKAAAKELAPGESSEDDGDDSDILPGDEGSLFMGKGDDIEKILAPYFTDSPSPEKTSKEEPKPQSPRSTQQDTPMSRAANFFIDNDRMFQRLINTHAATKMKIREANDAPGEIPSSDMSKAERSRKERAQSDIDSLVSQFISKIQAEDEETQKAILVLMKRKLESVNAAHLYKRIVRNMNMEPNELDADLKEHFRKIANIK